VISSTQHEKGFVLLYFSNDSYVPRVHRLVNKNAILHSANSTVRINQYWLNWSFSQVRLWSKSQLQIISFWELLIRIVLFCRNLEVASLYFVYKTVMCRLCGRLLQYAHNFDYCDQRIAHSNSERNVDMWEGRKLILSMLDFWVVTRCGLVDRYKLYGGKVLPTSSQVHTMLQGRSQHRHLHRSESIKCHKWWCFRTGWWGEYLN
jgi:hypothetical protein